MGCVDCYTVVIEFSRGIYSRREYIPYIIFLLVVAKQAGGNAGYTVADPVMDAPVLLPAHSQIFQQNHTLTKRIKVILGVLQILANSGFRRIVSIRHLVLTRCSAVSYTMGHKEHGPMETMKVISVSLDLIDQNENTRTTYKVADLIDLMSSMKKDGLLQPVGLRLVPGTGRYDAVFGNRRIVVARKLDWVTIPAHIVEAKEDSDRDILNIVENVKRTNTTVAEDGRMFQVLIDRGLTLGEVCVRTGLSKDRVQTALSVWSEVPAKYHKDIVNTIVGGGSRKALPGSVSAGLISEVMTLRRTHRIDKKGLGEMLEYAKGNSASIAQLRLAGPMLARGLKLQAALEAVQTFRPVEVTLFIQHTHALKLEKKHDKSIRQILIEAIENIPELKMISKPEGKRRPHADFVKGAVERSQ